jgi:hypothetical protein
MRKLEALWEQGAHYQSLSLHRPDLFEGNQGFPIDQHLEIRSQPFTTNLVFEIINRNGPWLTAFIRRDTVSHDPMAGRQH